VLWYGFLSELPAGVRRGWDEMAQSLTAVTQSPLANTFIAPAFAYRKIPLPSLLCHSSSGNEGQKHPDLCRGPSKKVRVIARIFLHHRASPCTCLVRNGPLSHYKVWDPEVLQRALAQYRICAIGFARRGIANPCPPPESFEFKIYSFSFFSICAPSS